MIEMTEKEVEKVAEILGGASAAAMALTNAEHRRAAGEVVRFFRAKNSIIVWGYPIGAQAAAQQNGESKP